MLRFFGFVFIFLFLGCSGDNSPFKVQETIFDSSVEPITEGTWYQPDLNTTWQWQLSGILNTSYIVDMYDVDLFDTSAESIFVLQENGKKVICYFSAGSYEDWREDALDFASEVKGLQMDSWDELWLDISNESLAPIMRARLDLAVAKGCDGVEPDNMDGYTNNSGFALSADNQLAYNKFIANEAHERGLSVGLKNDLNQILELEPYYDFAVNEQCFEYAECDVLSPFTNLNKSVFNAEYSDVYKSSDTTLRDAMCLESSTLNFQTLILSIDLNNSYRDNCN